MAHIGRTVKNIEAPRPLKSQSSRTQLNNKNNNFLLIEELIQLIERVALTLQAGICNPEPMALLVQNLRIHGPQLESVSKDTLDRSFVIFRNSSQDERLNIMTRLNLLELIELRAKGWEDNGINSYYKTKATNVEPESANNSTSMIVDQSMMSTSPTTMMSGVPPAVAAHLQQQHQLQMQQQMQQQPPVLAPGEIIRNSGKFMKPTKIPGKNYCKDEVVIRNADSGKVNPGAKERLVQITGPSEEKIIYAKQLIEDTIRRNASPVRLEPSLNTMSVQGANSGAGGSCSSLASSASDETANPRGIAIPAANRSSFGAVTMPHPGSLSSSFMGGPNNSMMAASTPISAGRIRPSQSSNQMLLHSFSTNDASVGEYKHTVNVGNHVLKITGDNWDLVRAAKLVLEDYFCSNEFLASIEAGAAFDGSSTMLNSTSTPTTPMSSGPFMNHQLVSSPFADSGISLNYMAGQFTNNATEGDDDVFVDSTTSQVNGLTRSRRSHFSRKDSTTDGCKTRTDKADNNVRIVHEYERLIYYAKSPHSWALPENWQEICEKFPSVVRNKDTDDESNRFDAEKHLQINKSGGKRNVGTFEESTADVVEE